MPFETKYKLSFGLVFALICLSIIHAAPSFDGAMNLLPAKNLVLFGKYYSFFFEEYFHPFIQTRATLQLPAALCMWVGGVNYFTALLPSALYTFFFIFLSEKLVRAISTENTLNYFVLPLFFCVPFYFHVGLHGWGEIITFFFIFLALISWVKIIERTERKFIHYFFFGFFIGLAILTKTVALISLPAFGVAFLLLIILEKKIDFHYILSFVGLAVPLVLYELVKFYLMGADDYFIWWKSETNAIAAQAGVREEVRIVGAEVANKVDYLAKFVRHLRATAAHINIPPFILALYFVLPVAFVLPELISKQAKKSSKIILLFTITLIGGYLVWWLVVSPTYKVEQLGKFRRILPAFLLVTLLIAYHLHHNLFPGKGNLVQKITSGVMLLLSLFIGFCNMNNLIEIVTPDKSEVVSQNYIKILNELPDEAKLYGMGYRHNPQIALLYDRHFDNFFRDDFDTIVQSEHSYIIRDEYAWSTNTFNELLDVLEHDTIIAMDTSYIAGFDLFKIKGLKEDVPRKDSSLLSSCLIGTEIQAYENKIGTIQQDSIFDSRNIGWIWATTRFGVLLEKGEHSLIKLKLLYTPKKKYKKKNIKVTIFYNDTNIGDYNLMKGINTLLVSIPIELQNKGEYAEVFLDMNTELSYNNKSKATAYFGICMSEICLLDTNENPDGLQVEEFVINAKKRLWLTLSNNEIPINLNNIELYVDGRLKTFNKAPDGRILIQMPKYILNKGVFEVFLINTETNEKTETYYLEYDAGGNIVKQK